MKVLHVLLNTGPTNMAFNDLHLQMQDSEVLSYLGSEQARHSAQGRPFELARQLYRLRHDYQVIHLHAHALAFIASLVYLLTSPATLRKCVYTVHTSRPNLSWKSALFYRVALLLVGRVIYCGQASQTSFADLLSRLTRSKQACIPNGVSLSVPGLGRNKSQNRFIYVGRLIGSKNVALLLESFRLSKVEAQLTLVGGGDLSQSLQESFADHRIHFAGLLPRSDTLQQLADSRVYISCSLVEGLPVAAIEAAACGNYLLLSDIPAHRELAAQIPHVSLVDSAESLIQALKLLDKKPESEFIRIASDNARAVEVSFNTGAMLKSYQAIYSEVAHQV